MKYSAFRDFFDTETGHDWMDSQQMDIESSGDFKVITWTTNYLPNGAIRFSLEYVKVQGELFDN